MPQVERKTKRFLSCLLLPVLFCGCPNNAEDLDAAEADLRALSRVNRRLATLERETSALDAHIRELDRATRIRSKDIEKIKATNNKAPNNKTPDTKQTKTKDAQNSPDKKNADKNKNNEKTTTLNFIARVQTALKNAGYDPGPIDGKTGPRTRAALKKFQRDNNLPTTATADDKTVKVLFRYLPRE